jgi:hypothetical protein
MTSRIHEALARSRPGYWSGATTLSITTLSIKGLLVTFSIMTISIVTLFHYAG